MTLTDELPTGIAWAIAPAVEGCEISDEGVLTCTIGALASSNSVAVTVVGETTPADCGTIDNTASATAKNEVAGADDNNSDDASITVDCPDIEVEKTHDAPVVSGSDRVSFTITATNAGDGRADGVRIIDALPAGFNWTVTGEHAATCEVVDGKLVCSIGTLASGASTAIVVSAPATMAQCGVIANVASAEAGYEPGDALGNNTSSAEVEITCPSAPTPGTPVTPGSPQQVPVTTLPVTGSGDASGGSMTALRALMIAMAGVATLTASRPGRYFR